MVSQKLIVSKDIVIGQTDSDTIVLLYSDYYGKRREFLFKILEKKYHTIEFHCSSFLDLRWNIIYSLILAVSRAKNKYIISNTQRVKVNFLIWIYIMKSFLSALIQSLFIIPYLIILVFCIVVPQKKSNNNFSRKESAIFLRTKLSRHLTAGGSLGHIIGVVSGLMENNIKVMYTGFDSGINMNPEVSRLYLSARDFILSLPVFAQIEASFSFILQLLNNKDIDWQETFIYYRPVSLDLTALFIAKFFRVPLIIEFNSSLLWEERNNGVTNKFRLWFIGIVENLCLRNASSIVCVSDVLRKQLLAKGIEKNKVVTVPNGVNISKFTSGLDSSVIKSKYNLQDSIIVGFVGTFGPWHGIDLLTETIKRITNYGIRNVKFLLVGDGQLRMDCQKQLSNLPHVIFTGKVNYEEIQHYLAACDILLSPHSLPTMEKEFIGSPTKLFEYMAMGKIVLGTRIGQLVQILSPSLDLNSVSSSDDYAASAVGILVKPEVEEYSSALIQIVSNFDRLKYVGNNARLKAVKHFSWKARMKTMLKAISL